MSISYELKPLSPEETGAYVMHRLAIAGGGAVVTFAPPALARMHRCTAGIPRLINLVCDRALLAAYSAKTNRVQPAHVLHAAETLDIEIPRSAFLKMGPSARGSVRGGPWLRSHVGRRRRGSLAAARPSRRP